MKYYRWNQIAMAVLGALLLFFGTRALIDILQKEHEPEKPGVEVAGTEETKEGEEKPGGPNLAVLLAEADAANGEQAAKKCAICHTFDKGGKNLIGPNLYGVLGRKVASHEGYEYSDALKAKDGEWDYVMIDDIIENPNAFAPGTKMALFAGLPDAGERADVILFLRSKSDSPAPLPAAGEEAPAAEPAPPAEEETPAPPAEMPAAEPEAPAESESPAEPEPAPPAEAPPAAEEEPAPSEPSMGEPPSPSQPQPVYPDQETGEPAAETPAEETPAEETPASMGEPPSPSQPQPVYPD